MVRITRVPGHGYGNRGSHRIFVPKTKLASLLHTHESARDAPASRTPSPTELAMNDPKTFAFARSFVHAVTVRPFFSDLKRMHDDPHILRVSPPPAQRSNTAPRRPAAA